MMRHINKLTCCCKVRVANLVFFLFLLSHGFLLCKQEKTGFGKTHFVVGAKVTTVRADTAAERLKKTLHCEGQGRIAHALFCPDDDTRGLLLDLISCEKKALHIAAFLLTDEVIAHALIDAHQKGIVVDVVTDQLCCQEGRGKAGILHQHGIEVLVYCGKCRGNANSANRSDIMHNKFIIFESNVVDKSIVWTGSFNFTHSARLRNQENVLIVDEPGIVDRYRKQFGVIKTRCRRYSADLFLKKDQMVTRKKNNGTRKHSIDRGQVQIVEQR